MDIKNIYELFPTQDDCLEHLEAVLWRNQALCPYCRSIKITPVKKEHRYHCNLCNTSFSVTVGTIFHKTKIDLQKWLLALHLILYSTQTITSRGLAEKVCVNKNTAWYILIRIKDALLNDRKLLEQIINFK